MNYCGFTRIIPGLTPPPIRRGADLRIIYNFCFHSLELKPTPTEGSATGLLLKRYYIITLSATDTYVGAYVFPFPVTYCQPNRVGLSKVLECRTV